MTSASVMKTLWAVIRRLVVDGSARRRGIGSALLAEQLRRLDRRGVKRFLLHLPDDADERARREREVAATEPMTAERAEREDGVETRFYEPERDTAAAIAGSDRKVEIREGGAPLAPRTDVDEERPPPA